MVEENNHPQSPYPGPAEPNSEEEVYPDIHDEHDDDKDGSPGNKAVEGQESDANPPVDEDEEPSPGNRL